jgi:hypothetical protein
MRSIAAAFAASVVLLLAPTPAPASPDGPPAPWPPVKGQPYPQLVLKDHKGETFDLSTLRGKVVVIEPVGISCPACQAFSGGASKGGFRGVTPQTGLPSYEELLREHAKLRPTARGLVFVQLLLYDMSASKAPTVEDARAWAEHFGLSDAPNTHVLVGDARYVNQASYDLIPGFQVIDRAGVLRADGTGHQPKDDPYRGVLGLIPALLAERAPR